MSVNRQKVIKWTPSFKKYLAKHPNVAKELNKNCLNTIYKLPNGKLRRGMVIVGHD